MKKTLGIIGGMGPDATAIFFRNVIKRTADCEKDQDHLRIIVDNNTNVPDRTAAILSRDPAVMKTVTDELLRSIKLMESAGVSNIAIPCNTATYFIPQLQKQTKINVINIVEETARAIAARADGQNAKVGIMATDGTLASKIYHTALVQKGLTPVTPETALQSKVMDIIYNQIKKTGIGNLADFNEVYAHLTKRGCDYVILGCTELSWFGDTHKLPKNCVDALEVLTRVSIQKSGKRYKYNP